MPADDADQIDRLTDALIDIGVAAKSVDEATSKIRDKELGEQANTLWRSLRHFEMRLSRYILQLKLEATNAADRE